MKRALTLFSSILLVTLVFAQKNYTQEADNNWKSESYFTAVDLYKKAYTKEKNRTEKIRIIFRIGECYRLIENPQMAIEWYLKSEKAKYGLEDPLLFFHLAETHRLTGKYSEAKEYYNQYKELVPSDPKGQEGYLACEKAEKWTEKPTAYLVENESQLNSKQYDYSPALLGRKSDEMIFVSSRPGTMGNELDSRSGESFSDLFFSEQDRKGKWSIAKPLATPVNTEFNEGSATITDRDKEIYYTHCPIEKNKSQGCEIWKATKRATDWVEPVKMKFFDDSVTVGHPSISSKDQLLFFSSNAPNGKGGKDIWFVAWDDETEAWGEPQNVESINTPGDEMFPFIKKDGTLYFASTGHLGMGGLDMFKAEQTGKNQWGEAENLRFPLNSPSHDFGIVFIGNKDKGFFASNRSGGKGGDDIYSFKLPPIIYTLTGTIRDIDCNKPVSGAIVKLIGTDGSSVETLTDAQGFYQFDKKENDERYVMENTSYTVVVAKSSAAKNISTDCSSTDYRKRGYLQAKGQETTVAVERSTAFVKDFGLQCSNCGEINFSTVLYQVAQSELMVTPEVNSKDSLNDLYQVLIENPNIVIELLAHTDARGGDAANLALSQKRAQSCVDYLISKGISVDRLVAKGLGETSPLRISENGTTTVYDEAFIGSLSTKQEKEAAHQANRRTVFSILRDDYVPSEPELNIENEAPIGGSAGDAGDQ